MDTNQSLDLKSERLNYFVNLKHVMIFDLRLSANFFTCSYPILSQVGFIKIIFLLYQFKVYESTQIRKKMLLHFKLFRHLLLYL